MTTRPIILRDWQVRAALAGKLSLIVVPIRTRIALSAVDLYGPDFLINDGNVDLLSYAPGDLLWVQETWCPGNDGTAAVYKDRDSDAVYPIPGWKSPVTMPRWASRTTLRVKNVAVKRVQEITADEAIDTGIDRCLAIDPLLELPRWVDNPWCAFVGVETINKNVDEVK